MSTTENKVKWPGTADTLIVGAGPTGLALCVALLAARQDVVIVDSQPEGANTSRAAVVYPRTMELLEPYGVAGRLAGKGIKTPQFTIRDRDKILLAIPFDWLPTEFRYTLLVSQAVTESVLLERLKDLGGRVLRPHTLVGLEQETEVVIATFDDGEQIRARYLIGADGVHSTVREKAGIEFDTISTGASFSIGDVRLSGGVPDDELVVYFSPAGHLVVLPLPGGIHRIVANVSPAPEHPGLSLFQEVLDERGPKTERAVVHEVLWSSRFRVNHGVVQSYRAGRVLLAGDAAHTHSPLGGQGMNTGIADAVMLGQTLAEAQRAATLDMLDGYAAIQQSVARQVVSITDTLTWLATMKGLMRPVRNFVLRLLSPFIRKRLAWRLSLLVYRSGQERALRSQAPPSRPRAA